jgi:hypothetical protein
VLLVLAALGAAMALGGALTAARWAATPAVAGRGLLVMTGGGVVAMSGFGTAPAAAAMAAGIAALFLAAALAPSWEQAPGSGPTRWLGAAALAAAGGVPIGLGAVAITLELAAALSLGRAAAGLTACLAAAAVLGVVGAVRAGIAHAAGAAPAAAWAVPYTAGVALVASLGAALVPGAAVGGVVGALGGSGGLRAVGQAAVAGPAGGWASGYFLPAVLLAVVAMASLARLQGWVWPGLSGSAPRQPRAGRAAWSRALRAGRAVRRPLRTGTRVMGVADSWLLAQPQLPLVLIGALLAILLIR